MLDFRNSDRRREAPEGGAITRPELRNPNGRLVSFGFFVERRRG